MSNTNTARNTPRAHPITFAVGGNVFAKKGFYVSRSTDAELLSQCREGNFAFVLAPRQLGKTSLVIQTSQQLREENILSVIVDLSPIGKKTTIEQEWYLSLLGDIIDQLDLEIDLDAWWAQNSKRGASKALVLFLREVMLKQISQPVVIFLDEIDSTINLEFKDDFFATLRYVYNARGITPDLQRVSFVLIGVATPNDLISDPYRTPFNVGYRVDLNDFTLPEAMPLVAGLRLPPEEAQQVLEWIFKWTMGHPYLTMRVCRLVADSQLQSWSEKDIDNLVADSFFGKIDNDLNLQFVRDMLTLRVPPEVPQSDVLMMLKEIRRRPIREDKRSIVQSHLKLSGVAREENHLLKVRNPVYSEVFDNRWIKEHLPETWVKHQYQKVRRVAVGLIFLLGVLVILSVYALTQTRIAKSALVVADQQRSLADAARDEAERQKEIAQTARNREQVARELAEEGQVRANDAALRAEVARKEADTQRHLALERLSQVQKQQSLAEARGETDRLYRDGVDLFLQGDQPGAISKFQKALSFYTQPNVNDLSGEAITLRNIAAAYAQSQNWPEAVKYYESALKAYRKIAAPAGRSGEAFTLLSLGKAFRRTDEPKKARESLTQARVLAQKLPDDSSALGNVLRALGDTYAPLGYKSIPKSKEDREAAISYYRQAADAYHAAGNYAGEVDSIQAILVALSADDLNKFGKLEDGSDKETAKLAYERLSRLQAGGESFSQARALRDVIAIYAEGQNKTKVNENFEKLLEVFERTSNDDAWPEVGANVYGMLDDQRKQQTIMMFDRVLKSLDQEGSELKKATTYRVLSEIYYSSGDTLKAVEAMQQAAKVYQQMKAPKEEADSLVITGNLQYGNGKPIDALQSYRRALASYRSAGDKSRREPISLLRAIGELEYALGKPEEAIATFNDLVHAYSAYTVGASSFDSYRFGQIVLTVGELYQCVSGPEAASNFFDKTLAGLPETDSRKSDLLIQLAFRSLIFSGGRQQAVAYANQAFSVSEPKERANSLISLAQIYQYAGNKADALKAYDRAYDLYRAKTEPDEYDYTINELVDGYRSLGEGERAAKIYLQSLQARPFRSIRNRYDELLDGP